MGNLTFHQNNNSHTTTTTTTTKTTTTTRATIASTTSTSSPPPINNNIHPHYQSFFQKRPRLPELLQSSKNYVVTSVVPTVPVVPDVVADQFISWISVALLLVLLLFFRSTAAPFLNPRGEPRRATESSIHFQIIVYLFSWLLSSTALTIFSQFSPHHANVIVAASLFFPMIFATIVTIMGGRFVVRVVYRMGLIIRERMRRAQRRGVGGDDDDDEDESSVVTAMVGMMRRLMTTTTTKTTTSSPHHHPTLVAFHRPFRSLLKTSIFVSLSICTLFAHCWSPTLKALKYKSDDGATTTGAVCRVVFRPLSFGWFLTSGSDGIDENGIWVVWLIMVGWIIIGYAQDEFAGRHYYRRRRSHYDPRGSKMVVEEESDGIEMMAEDTKNSEDSTEDNDNGVTTTATTAATAVEGDDGGDDWNELEFMDKMFINPWTIERPEGVLAMVPWYSILLFTSCFDILVQLHVFLGRFDARTMQPALQKKNHKKINDDDDDVSGCVFDFSHKETDDNNNNNDGAFWFDFVADTGDGFHSSYQVARLLAQPSLVVRQKKKKRGGEDDDDCYDNKSRSSGGGGSSSKDDDVMLSLPRGDLLIIGGDLAYPDPTRESYEQRFFRVFEDAMPPPPSYRRESVSLSKPALPVKGWVSCFGEENSSNDERVDDCNNSKKHDATKEEETSSSLDLLRHYKGPCAFCIPGNHDWFDGLSTYTRYILSRDWLGGWLLPQTRSYLSLRLPHGWWILMCDLALSNDIDIEQFRFFARLAKKDIKKDDAVIIVTHEPQWVLDAVVQRDGGGGEEKESLLRELMDFHLRGRVRLRLAGDLHHYTRHVPVRRSSMLSSLSRSMKDMTTADGGGGMIDDNDDGIEEQRMRRCYRSDVWRDGDDDDDDDEDENDCTNDSSSDVNGDNQPELIVSGGGGAFLHGTHTFANVIKVGTKKDTYRRVCAYPDEKVSMRLGWLNILQFRWRNWRLDIVWAIVYFGLASSLFPLCGIYGDYLEYNPDHNPLSLIIWVIRKNFSLFWDILQIGRISFIFVILLTISLLFFTDDQVLKPSTRITWGLTHAMLHIFSALTCLLFVESVTEWMIFEGVVKINHHNDDSSFWQVQHRKQQLIPSLSPSFPSFSTSSYSNDSSTPPFDLASSLYDEYTTHFSHIFVDFSSHMHFGGGDNVEAANATVITAAASLSSAVTSNATSDDTPITTSAPPITENITTTLPETIRLYFRHQSRNDIQKIYATIVNGWNFIFDEVPFLKTTLAVFDLPGTIARKHAFICNTLCHGRRSGDDVKTNVTTMERIATCRHHRDNHHLIHHNYYHHLTRGTILTYLLSIFLYFVVLAIPFAGTIFGTWLALTLNAFGAQYNEGFSSLRIEHWKNFLKLRIAKDGSTLDVYAVGLNRVPKRWMRDDDWDGGRDKRAKRLKRRRWRWERKLSLGMTTAQRNVVDDDCGDVPSWRWERPSRWIPMSLNSKKFVPDIVDYARIEKRPLSSSRSGIKKRRGRAFGRKERRFASAPDFSTQF